MTANDGWGPDHRDAAISLTFDNLGEAREIGAGIWPEGQPIGSHVSVTRGLPRVLAELQRLNVKASFFVEGWNIDVYPSALGRIQAAGHDLGLHGWVHEPWGRLDPSAARSLIERGLEHAEGAGVTFSGFRPPGGVMDASTIETLSESGLAWASPLGSSAALTDDVAVVPFLWQVVDAYYVFDELGPLRASNGDPPERLDAEGCATAIRRAIDGVIATGGYTALTLHPFLLASDDAFAACGPLMEEIAGDPRVWCAPCSEVAAWMKTERTRFDALPDLGGSSWM